MRRPFHVMLMAAVCAVLLAACGGGDGGGSGGGGGSSKAEYEKDVQKIGKAVEEDLDALGGESPSAEDIETAQERIGEAAEEIDDLDPPSGAQKPHDELVSVLRDTADLMGRIAPLMESATEDPTKLSEDQISELEQVQTDFSEIEQRMQQVEEDFDEEGLDVGLNSDDGSDSEGDGTTDEQQKQGK